MTQPAPENPPKRRGGNPPEANRFRPGQSGNPGGRPKGFAAKVREILGNDDGETIARFWAATMADPDADMKDRLAASKLLAERAWGKPPQFAPMQDDDPLSFRDEEADAIAADFDTRLGDLDAKRAERAAAEAPPVTAE